MLFEATRYTKYRMHTCMCVHLLIHMLIVRNIHTICICMCIYYIHHCRVIDGVCTGVDIGELVVFDVSVDIIECTSELINGPTE